MKQKLKKKRSRRTRFLKWHSHDHQKLFIIVNPHYKHRFCTLFHYFFIGQNTDIHIMIFMVKENFFMDMVVSNKLIIRLKNLCSK